MTLPDSWFRTWFNSPYYHQLYFQRDEGEAAGFIHLLLNHLQLPQNAVLADIACGRGRYSKIIASKNYDVTGIDLSFDSIAFAKQFETEKLHFFQHDIRLPFWINYFDGAFNFFTSFGYFRTEREHYNAIRTIANALKPGGVLVLDYLNVHYIADNLVPASEKEIDGVNYTMTRWFDETHFYKKIIVEDHHLPGPQEFTERVAKFSLGDFNDMFAFHHLQILQVYGDYKLGSYDVKKSPRLIMIAKKPDAGNPK
jgi:SAM-dependent methyltransferase